VTSVARSVDIQLQPHHMFAVTSLQLEAMHAAKNITKPGVFHSTLFGRRQRIAFDGPTVWFDYTLYPQKTRTVAFSS